MGRCPGALQARGRMHCELHPIPALNGPLVSAVRAAVSRYVGRVQQLEADAIQRHIDIRQVGYRVSESFVDFTRYGYPFDLSAPFCEVVPYPPHVPQDLARSLVTRAALIELGHEPLPGRLRTPFSRWNVAWAHATGVLPGDLTALVIEVAVRCQSALVPLGSGCPGAGGRLAERLQPGTPAQLS